MHTTPLKTIAAGLILAACTAVTAQAAPDLGLRLEEAGFAPFETTSPSNPLTHNGPYGTFLVDVNTVSVIDNPLAFLLTANEISGSTPGTLTITATGTDLTSPSGLANFLSQFSGTFVAAPGVTNPTITLDTFYNASNTAFATETPLASLTGGPLSPFSVSHTTGETTTTPFSVTEVMRITTHGTSQLGLTGQIDGLSRSTPVPEPTSLAILGAALAGFAAMRRRRKS